MLEQYAYDYWCGDSSSKSGFIASWLPSEDIYSVDAKPELGPNTASRLFSQW